MIEVAGIDHVVLRTNKLQEMLDFYAGVLGCAVERETTPEMGLIQLRAGQSLIDLVTVDGRLGRLGGEAPTESGNNMDHFCLQIEPVSMAALIEYLQGFGIETGAVSQRYGAQGVGESLYIKDPEGNTVELRNRIITDE